MISDINIVEEPVKTLSMNPKKFILWLFIATIVMLFAAMTSAYIVRKVEGNWLDFQLPSIFISTTVVILMSSLTMQWAYTLVRKDDLNKAKIALGLTFALGVLFLIGQVLGWGALIGADVYLVGNPAGSFLYVLTGLHGLHLIAGLVFILTAFIAVVKYKVHSRNITTLEMCVTFWHFLGGLWLYLYIFLLLNR
jgi:cytochrome c oxidase subunit 3